MEIFLGMLFIAALGTLYVLSYYFNHKTPKPKGCESIDSVCEGCKITSCQKNPVYDYKESKNA